jgi:hypothetical protein
MKNPYAVDKKRGREVVAARKAEQIAKQDEGKLAFPHGKTNLVVVPSRFRIVSFTRDTEMGTIEIGVTELQPGDYIEVEESF